MSLYADDLVLFLKPHYREMWLIKHLLNLFEEASGLEINYLKTTATLIRGDAEDETRVSQTLECQVTNFPIQYLGLQLALKPLTRAEWQPMLDKAIEFLPA